MNRVVPPRPEDVGYIAPRGRDYFRIAWWMVKAARYSPRVWVASSVGSLTVASVAALTVGLGLQASVWAVLASAIVGAAAYFALLAVVVAVATPIYLAITFGRRPLHHAYMDPKRVAVLELIERPDEGAWQIRNHVAAKTKKRYGERLRALAIPGALDAAGRSGTKIYGKAQNAAVMKVYVKHLGPFGFHDDGKGNIVWP